MKRIYRLVHSEARRRAQEDVKTAPDGFVVTVAEPTRNNDQNAAQWPILQAFAEQLQWPVNGRMESMTPEEWKDVLHRSEEHGGNHHSPQGTSPDASGKSKAAMALDVEDCRHIVMADSAPGRTAGGVDEGGIEHE